MKDLPICVDTCELDVLGSGFPLYYHFKKFVIIIYFLMVAIVGIACVIINVFDKDDRGWDVIPRIVIPTTVWRDREGSDSCVSWELLLQTTLHLVFLLVMIVASIILRISQNEIIKEIDEKNITPSDFGLMVSNIPKDKRPDELRNWFKEKFPDVDIVYVNYCYNIEELVQITRKIEALERKKIALEAYKSKVLEEKGLNEQDAAEQGIKVTPTKYFCWIKRTSIDIETLENKIVKAQEEQKEIMQSMGKLKDSQYFSGKAFVVINKQSEAAKIVEYFETTIFSRAYTYIKFDIFK